MPKVIRTVAVTVLWLLCLTGFALIANLIEDTLIRLAAPAYYAANFVGG